MTSNMKNTIWNLFKLFVTVAIILLLFTRVDIAALARHLAQANLLLLLIALALYFLAILIGTIKWRILVHAQEMHVSLPDLLSFALVGLFFGNLLPGNVGGDVVRAYGLVRATGRAEAAAISVLVDRLMGLIAFLVSAVVMAALAAFTVTRGTEMEQLETMTIVAAVLLLLGSALLFSRRLTQRVAWVFGIGPLKRVQPIAARVYGALQVYRRRSSALVLNLMLSASIVIVTTLVWYTVALAVGANVSIFYFFVFNPLIAFVTMLPVSLNGLGPMEVTVVFFFGLIGIPSELALAMSLFFRIIIVLTSLPGGVLWWRERRLAPAAPERAQQVVSE